MGLDIRPGKAAWSYGGFARFRERLAHSEGFDLREMRGFGGERDWETESGQHITPLAPLLNHSDADGYLHAWEAEEILLRLPAVLDSWEADADPAVQYDVEHGRHLVEALRHCVEHRCAVVFA